MSAKDDITSIVLSTALVVVIIIFIVTLLLIYRKKMKKCCTKREAEMSFQMTRTPKREDIEQNRISVFDSVYIPTTRPLSPLVKRSTKEPKVEKAKKVPKSYENVTLMPKSFPADDLPFSDPRAYSICSNIGMIRPLCPIKSSYDQGLNTIRESMRINLEQSLCPMELASNMGKSSSSLKNLDVQSLDLLHNDDVLHYATLQHPKKIRNVQKQTSNTIYSDIVKIKN